MKRFFEKLGESFQCTLCPHKCILQKGQIGKCFARKAGEDGIGLSYYGGVSAISIEPLEKKPIYHYKPGMKVLSVGFFGCSLNCDYCLPANTLIATPNGLVPISQIRDGDEIITFDNSSGIPQHVLARVGHVSHREVQELIELEVDGQTIQLTPEHPIQTKRGMVEAQYLKEDDEVLCDKTYLEQLRYLLGTSKQDKVQKE